MINFLFWWFFISTILALVTYFSVFQYCQREYHVIAKEDYQYDKGLSLLLALIVFVIPPAFILIIFFTSFFKYGIINLSKN